MRRPGIFSMQVDDGIALSNWCEEGIRNDLESSEI